MRAPRHSADHWSAVIAEYRRGEEPPEAFCQRRGIHLATFRRWHSRLSAGAPPAKRSARSGFVEIRPAPAPPTQASVMLRWGSELSLECPASLGMDTIAQLARRIRDGR